MTLTSGLVLRSISGSYSLHLTLAAMHAGRVRLHGRSRQFGGHTGARWPPLCGQPAQLQAGMLLDQGIQQQPGIACSA